MRLPNEKNGATKHDKIIEVLRYYGVQMAAEKTKVVGILVQPFHGTDYDISKKSEEC